MTNYSQIFENQHCENQFNFFLNVDTLARHKNFRNAGGQGWGGGRIKPFCKLLYENQTCKVPLNYDTCPTLVHTHVLVTPPS
jgi:hypothetical protein